MLCLSLREHHKHSWEGKAGHSRWFQKRCFPIRHWFLRIPSCGPHGRWGTGLGGGRKQRRSPCPSQLWPQKQPRFLDKAIAWRECDEGGALTSPSSCGNNNNKSQLPVSIESVFEGCSEHFARINSQLRASLLSVPLVDEKTAPQRGWVICRRSHNW